MPWRRASSRSSASASAASSATPPAATTTLTLIIVGDVILGQLLPAGLRQYLPGTATQAAITVHRSAGLLTPDAAIAVLGAYAAIALAAALIRVAHRDA